MNKYSFVSFGWNIEDGIIQKVCMQLSQKQISYSEMKLEQDSPDYLFNKLLGNPKQADLQAFLTTPSSPDRILMPQKQLLGDISTYLCLRTTRNAKILQYARQYYNLPFHRQAIFLSVLRKQKLRLKRQNAKSKCLNSLPMQKDYNCTDQVKQCEQEAQLVYSQQSQQTKKKKRNRISAQISRDRKKQYLLQLQQQNKELRRKVEILQGRKNAITSQQQFLKIIICLGITCLAQVATDSTDNKQLAYIANSPLAPNFSALTFPSLTSSQNQAITGLFEWIGGPKQTVSLFENEQNRPFTLDISKSEVQEDYRMPFQAHSHADSQQF